MKKYWLAFLLILLCVGIAQGQTTDYQLAICQAGATCPAPSGTGIFGGEVNGLSGSTFQIASPGNITPPENPVLLIVGVPNGGAAPPAITQINGVTLATPINATAVSVWGGTFGNPTPFSSGTDAYAALGLGSAKTGQNSESFTNWQNANAALGLTTTRFSLYVYAVPNTGTNGLGLGGSSQTSGTFTFGGTLTQGTFIVAYSCSTGSTTTSCTQQGDNMGATPFTQAGEIVSVPEPTVLTLLLSTGLVGLVGAIRRRF